MSLKNRIAIVPAVLAVCIVAGCFSYHKDVHETDTPAPVVAVPPVTSSTTTTTTDNGVVERQRTTTYTSP
jgi:hypothetical protein